MLFPISDDDRDLRGVAPITIILIALNILVFLFLQQAGQNEEFTHGYSVIPFEITSGADLVSPQVIQSDQGEFVISQSPGPTPIYLTVFSAMFMHGGWLHLGSNLLFLWIFGDNVEQRFGKIPFLLFYLLSGVVATFAQIYLDPDGIIPNLGASGAISGVLGAYLVLFPRNRVHALFFWFIVSVPAFLAIGTWIVLQLFNGWGSLLNAGESLGGVAYGAHIGGFFAGVVLAFIMRTLIKKEPEDPYKQFPVYQRSRRYW